MKSYHKHLCIFSLDYRKWQFNWFRDHNLFCCCCFKIINRFYSEKNIFCFAWEFLAVVQVLWKGSSDLLWLESYLCKSQQFCPLLIYSSTATRCVLICFISVDKIWSKQQNQEWHKSLLPASNLVVSPGLAIV